MLRVAEAAVGIVILAVAFYDVFQSVVLPRPSIGKLRIAPWILRPLWAGWRWWGTRETRLDRRENRLGTFGPVGLLALLAFWALSSILGYALIIDSIPDQIEPPPQDFWTSLYFSASTLLPLSYGEILPIGLPRPRDQIATKGLPEFADLRAHVQRLIRVERTDEAVATS